MMNQNQQRRWFNVLCATFVLFAGLFTQAAMAKEILKGVEASENRVFIRTDGLACYFCAYGLERFFKKTRRIAVFDMDMEEALVEAVFVRGQPLVPAQILNRFVHDAGFTPRWIDAELVGTLVFADESVFLELRETGEKIPLDDTEALRSFRDEDRQLGGIVRVRGRASEDDAFPMRLAAETINGESYP